MRGCPSGFHFSKELIFLRGGRGVLLRREEDSGNLKHEELSPKRTRALKNCSSSAVRSRKLVKSSETLRDAETKNLEETMIVGTILKKGGSFVPVFCRCPWCSEEHALPR